MTDHKHHWYNNLDEEYDGSGEILVHEESRERVTGIVWEDYANGNRRYEGLFVDGKLHGYEKWWYENGQLKSFRTAFKNWEHGSTFLKDDSGELIVRSNYSYGYQLSTELFENGILIKVKKLEEDPEKFARYQKRKAELEASGEAELWDKVLKYSEDV